MGTEIVLRPADLSDELERNHFLASWLRSMADSYFSQAVGREAFFRGHEKLLRERILPKSQIVVACLPDEPTVIVGWACFGENVIHYVYVKPKWRKLGIAKKLLEGLTSMGLVYTHRSRMCSDLPIPEKWMFDPYPALES